LKELLQQQKLEEEPEVKIGGKKRYVIYILLNQIMELIILLSYFRKLQRETPVTLSHELTGNLRTLKVGYIFPS